MLCYADMHECRVGSKMLKVSIARPSSATITNANLYVKVILSSRHTCHSCLFSHSCLFLLFAHVAYVCIVIQGLPLGTEDAALTALFAPYGDIISVRVLRDADGSPKGVGFVRFDQVTRRDIL